MFTRLKRSRTASHSVRISTKAIENKTLTVALCQIAPIWLQRDATLAKVVDWIGKAAAQACNLAVFGEALVPGYPFWVERTEGAKFESELQKSLYAHYVTRLIVNRKRQTTTEFND